jgi:FkbH-like protein
MVAARNHHPRNFDKVQITEALKITREYSSVELPLCQIQLVTGFNPLHLQTLFQAHLQRLLPTKRVIVSTGVYGDLAGTVARLQNSALDMCAIALEWSDLDPRLGFRRLGGWGHQEVADIVADAKAKLVAIRTSLESLPDHFPVALSLPILPLPPVFHTPSWQICAAELCLRLAADELALWTTGRANIRLVNLRAHQTNLRSPQVLDFKGELIAGLPYAMSHTDELAQCFAHLLIPQVSKKGLITDLDDTLWAGTAGEIGAECVSWDLDTKTQPHGLYQQLLRALADQGVLIGVASRNDSEIVDAVFRRPDIVLPRDRIFPIEAYWGAKSESVKRILDTWNVHADSVVFVDDSSSDLAEVKVAHPDMECIRFDGQDYAEVYSLLYRLRDLFAKQAVTEEDGLRLESLRARNAFREEANKPGAYPEKFLQDAEAKISFDFAAVRNPRSLELVNKTNQFNLDGTRYDEAEWRRTFGDPNTFVVSASYRDKYGPLGVIAVLAGQVSETIVTVKTWVMSCRAFGRWIEYQCLKAILDRFSAKEIIFQFLPTLRNGYFQEFSKSLLGETPTGPFSISRTVFLNKCPELYHEVEIHDD